MATYSTSQIAKKVTLHSNTIRLYEDLMLIPKAERKPNGYRVFTDVHLEQIKLVRLALRGEVLQGGLRHKAIQIIKTAATGDYEDAITQTEAYLLSLKKEQTTAEEAIEITMSLIAANQIEIAPLRLSRKDAAAYLGVTIDTLRNWELNGLITIPRKENSYRTYTEKEIQVLKIIKTLRCANYSLMSILRMLKALSASPQTNIREAIDLPDESEDIISVCDRLLTSLKNTEHDAHQILKQLKNMKIKFK